MPKPTKPKYSTDPMGIPFGPGHPLYDPIKNETSSAPTLTAEEIQQLIADALAGEQPDLSGFTTQGDVDKAIEAALGGIQGPDLSGYAQTGDVDTAIQQALAGQDFSQFATDADIQQALSGIQTGPDKQWIEQMIGDAIGGIQGPDLSGLASQADIQEALAGQDFSGFASQADIDEALAGIEQFDPSSFDFSEYMTAADAEELLRNMDTSGIEASVLQKMGVPDMLTDERVQEAINQAIGGAGILGEEDILRMIADQGGPDLSDYLKTGQAEQMFVDEAQVQQMIADGLAQGLSPEEIQAMIAEATGGQISEEMIQEMIANAIAGVEAGQEGALTEEQIQAMIDAATGEGMTAEQVQSIIGDQGYLTEDQIKAMMGESGYLGQEGVDASVQAALDAALGQGGAISSAIATAMQNQQKYDVDTSPQTPTYTAPPAGDPYGGQNPYALMLGQNAGTTPFAGGTTTGAENPYGLGSLDLGNTADYNFNMPTTSSAQPYPTGISPDYFKPPNKGMPENIFSDPSQDPNNPMFYGG